jgi:hypothetical protein
LAARKIGKDIAEAIGGAVAVVDELTKKQNAAARAEEQKLLSQARLNTALMEEKKRRAELDKEARTMLGGTMNELQAAYAKAAHAWPELQPLKAKLDSASVVEVPEPEPRFKLLNCNQLRDLPPLTWRVKGVFPDRGLAAIAGPSASGKSFLAFDLAAAIAGGSRWFGCRVEAAPVVYAALEGEGGFKLRAAAWEANRGQTLPDGLHLMLQPFKLTEANDVQDLAAVVPAGAVVIVDTLNRAAPTADENSSRDMGEILEAAKRLQALTDGLVILVHHTGKDESKGLRGHSSLFAALDAAVTVKRDGDRREWALTKSKDGADGQANPFKLLTETLGIDDYGDPLTSCVIAPSDEPPMGKKPKRMGECEGAVVEYLASAKVGVRKADVVKHFEGRYEKGPIYRAMKSLATACVIHEAAGMVCIANAAK